MHLKFLRLLCGLLALGLLLSACAPAAPASVSSAADPAPPPVPLVASYAIAVTLDPAAKTLLGRETITYTNTTSSPIPDLVLHLYLNAFRDAHSLFLTESGNSRGFQWDPKAPGHIDVTALSVTGGPALTLEALEDGTLARAALPAPIAPGQTGQFTVEFTALLPRAFARTGREASRRRSLDAGQIEQRDRANQHLRRDLVDGHCQKVFHLVQVHRHLVGESARTFAREIAHGHTLQLVHHHPAQAGDRGAHEPLGLGKRADGEPAVNRPEQQICERINAGPFQLLIGLERGVIQNLINENADGGVKRDVADRLPELIKNTPTQMSPFDFEQGP